MFEVHLSWIHGFESVGRQNIMVDGECIKAGHLVVDREQRGRKGQGNRHNLQRHVLVTHFL